MGLLQDRMYEYLEHLAVWTAADGSPEIVHNKGGISHLLTARAQGSAQQAGQLAWSDQKNRGRARRVQAG